VSQPQKCVPLSGGSMKLFHKKFSANAAMCSYRLEGGQRGGQRLGPLVTGAGTAPSSSPDSRLARARSRGVCLPLRPVNRITLPVTVAVCSRWWGALNAPAGRGCLLHPFRGALQRTPETGENGSDAGLGFDAAPARRPPRLRRAWCPPGVRSDHLRSWDGLACTRPSSGEPTIIRGSGRGSPRWAVSATGVPDPREGGGSTPVANTASRRKQRAAAAASRIQRAAAVNRSYSTVDADDTGP